MQGENEDPGIIITGMLCLMFQMLSLKGLNWYGNIHRPLRGAPECRKPDTACMEIPNEIIFW